MPGGRRIETEYRKRSMIVLQEPNQGNEKQRYSKHPKAHLGQRNIDVLPVRCDIVTSTSFVYSADVDFLFPGHSNYYGKYNVPCRYKNSFDHPNQERYDNHLHDNDAATDVLEQTRGLSDDIFLLNMIDSGPQLRALDLLKKVNNYSQAGLNKALILACRRGHKYLIQTLADLGANVNFQDTASLFQDTNGHTPLLICAENGFTDLVRFLLSRKADVCAVNSAGDNALILSIRSSGSTEMVKVLLEQPGININHQNRDGITALMRAVEVMDIDVIKILLDETYKHKLGKSSHFVKDIDCNLHDHIVNNNGQTAQEYAYKYGLGRIFRYLIKYRTTGMSPIVQAVEESDTESLNIFLNCQFLNKDDMVSEGFKKIFSTKNSQMKKTVNDSDVLMAKKLLECGADVNTNVYGYSPLSVAIEAGNYNLVELLCNHGAHIKKQYERDNGPLQTAARIGRCDLIELLLSYDADINQHHYVGSPLDCALSQGHIDCAKFLIQRGAKVDAKHALLSAVNHQMREYMIFLFDSYKQEVLDVFFEKPDTLQDLLITAIKAGNLETIGRILDAGADINRPSSTGVPPILESRNREVTQFLVQRGAYISQINDTTISGSFIPVITASAVRRRYDPSTKDVVQMLLEDGASANVMGKQGRTALMLAAEMEGCVDLLQILLDQGVDVHGKDTEGNTVLTRAILRGCSQNVSFLLQVIKAKNFINEQNHEGSTALMCATTKRHSSIIVELINHGADVNIKNVHGNTALHLLMKFFEPEAITLTILTILVNAGSDVNSQNNSGFSPLMLAARKFRNYSRFSPLILETSEIMKKAVHILLDSGADANIVSEIDNTRTALTCLLDNYSSFTKEIKCCMESFLERGASASYVSPLIVLKIIQCGYAELIPKMIRCGLGPADITPDNITQNAFENGFLFNLSPLCTALLLGNVALARYFMENLFLTNSDVSSLSCKNYLRCFLKRKNLEECLDFLDQISSQPLSLFALSHVAVTSALGTSPGRESRVNSLPLPQVLKDKLLFRTEEASSITLDTSETVVS